MASSEAWLSCDVHLSFVVDIVNTLREVALIGLASFGSSSHWTQMNYFPWTWIQLGAIINPSSFIWVCLHLLLIDTLLLLKPGLIETSFGIKSILIKISFLVELLVSIGSSDKIALFEELVEGLVDFRAHIANSSLSLLGQPCIHSDTLSFLESIAVYLRSSHHSSLIAGACVLQRIIHILLSLIIRHMERLIGAVWVL